MIARSGPSTANEPSAPSAAVCRAASACVALQPPTPSDAPSDNTLRYVVNGTATARLAVREGDTVTLELQVLGGAAASEITIPSIPSIYHLYYIACCPCRSLPPCALLQPWYGMELLEICCRGLFPQRPWLLGCREHSGCPRPLSAASRPTARCCSSCAHRRLRPSRPQEHLRRATYPFLHRRAAS